MCPAHRRAELKRVKLRLEADLPILCISTQLIEAGVDVDFAVVIRSAAGLDSIAQAAGRCNRNKRYAMGSVYIVNPVDEHVDKDTLKDIAEGKQKLDTALGYFKANPADYQNDLVGPKAMELFYTHYFFERKNEMGYLLSNKEAAELGRPDSLLSLLSLNKESIREAIRLDDRFNASRFLNQSFMSASKIFKAIESPTEGVVVPFGKEGQDLVGHLYSAFDLKLDMDLLRKAQQYTVSVFPHIFRKLLDAQALNQVHPELRIYSLDSRYYSIKFGLSTEPVSKMETLNV